MYPPYRRALSNSIFFGIVPLMVMGYDGVAAFVCREE
jgi:hypothetical protein